MNAAALGELWRRRVIGDCRLCRWAAPAAVAKSDKIITPTRRGQERAGRAGRHSSAMSSRAESRGRLASELARLGRGRLRCPLQIATPSLIGPKQAICEPTATATTSKNRLAPAAKACLPIGHRRAGWWPAPAGGANYYYIFAVARRRRPRSGACRPAGWLRRRDWRPGERTNKRNNSTQRTPEESNTKRENTKRPLSEYKLDRRQVLSRLASHLGAPRDGRPPLCRRRRRRRRRIVEPHAMAAVRAAAAARLARLKQNNCVMSAGRGACGGLCAHAVAH
jgi:hypothetical protein